MALLSVIRRWHFREGMPIREIERRTGLSRNTIRKYLRAGTVEPQFKVPDRPSKLDPFAEKLSGWLRIEAGRSRKQRRTAKQMYADLVTLGYDGSYNRVAAFAREWKADRQRDAQTSGRGTFVPLVFMPGEAFQFDGLDRHEAGGAQRYADASPLAQVQLLGQQVEASRVSRRHFSIELRSHIEVLKGRIVIGFGLGGRNVADGAEEALIVVPVHPSQSGHLDSGSARPGALAPDHLSLVEPVDGLG